MTASPVERRGEPRYSAVGVSATLVTGGVDGPETRRGRLLEVSGGGATLELDDVPEVTPSGPVLIVHAADGDVRLLVAPLGRDAEASRCVRLRFRQPVVPDPAWSELLVSLSSS